MSHHRTWALLTALLLLTVSHFSIAETPGLPPDESALTPKQLVERALAHELRGESEARDKLLHQAIELDANYAPARWQLGFVRMGDKWLKVEQVAEHAAEDEDLKAYFQKRDALVDTAADHREMARWCRKHRLSAEERLHWTKALSFEPRDPETLDALGLQWSEGRLLTRQQLDAERRATGQRKQALRSWRPRVLKLKAALDSGKTDKVAQATAELNKITDADALPALESGLAADPSNPKADRANLALIEIASRFATPEATRILLSRAVQADSPNVRLAACAALRQRPMHVYVPQLVSAMPATVETTFRVYAMPNGTVAHEHEVAVTGRGGKQIFSYESTVHPADSAVAQVITPAALVSEVNKAAVIESRAAALEGTNRELRERLQFVLKNTTGFENPEDPELFNQQYAEYYGLDETPKSSKVNRVNISETAGFYSNPAGTAGPFHHECFVAGTQVCTLNGPRAIETIQPGDRVLSQDPVTGELAYKTVLTRTLRQGVRVVDMKLGEETITATFGHPFWVIGEGWQVAGHIAPGSLLRALERDVRVESIEVGPAREVYNLLVTDFATYFVGQQNLLVHDDSQLVEAPVLIPGLVSELRQ